jgi:two-component system sensor histidine kinase UhpB
MPSVLHVLYAEDNAIDADLTRSFFAQHAPDFALQIVHRGEEFLSLARTGNYTALLLDQRLPDMEGLEVLKRLAQENIVTPLVLVTGVGDSELASQALRLGADDYLPKRSGYLRTLPDYLREVIDRRRRVAGPLKTRVRPRHVLLVEDRPAEVAVMIQHLSAAAPHLTVEVVTSPSRALDQLGSTREFDLVITDHRPPDVSGFDLMAEARRRGLRTPFILIAAAASEETVVAAFKLGASDYVLKSPRHYAELALRVDLAIDRHELTLANERAAEELAARQHALAALRQSERQLNLALEAGRIGLWSWQVGTRLTQFSSRWKAQLGYADHEIHNDITEWESRCDPDDLVKLRSMMTSYLAAPWPDYTLEYRMRHRDGTWRWFMFHADVEVDDNGRPLRILGSQIDITALKQQQAELASASARLQQLSRRLLEVQEQERRHLARELHDEIGQVLTVAKIHLQSVPVMAEAGDVHPSMQEPVQLLDRLLAQVRSLSLDLRPPLLDDLGLVAALNWLLQQPSARVATPRIHLSTPPAFGRCEPTLETACFRIAQEALTNALRHARAENIDLSLSVHGGSLHLTVSDDGIGFDAAAARVRAEGGSSIGLLGMNERASLAGGALTLLSAPGRGTKIEAIFPLSNSVSAP